MKKNYFKLLLLMAWMAMGGNAWGADVYTIVYGSAVYDETDGTTISGVNPQTDFTTDDGNIASDVVSSDANGDNCTNAMPIGGSVLYSSASFSKSFESPATKGIVHFEANYTSTTNGQETWKIVDSNGVEIFGTTDCGFSNGNATKSWGFSNGVSLGTNWFRQARKAHNRIVLDINLASKVVSYTVLISSGSNSYTTLTGTYNLPDGVSDVAGLTATKQNYYSYMDNVSFYNMYDDAVSEYPYTIKYQYQGETVLTEQGSAGEGNLVVANSTIWDSSNTQKYYVEDGATTEFTVSTETNEFIVAVREAEIWSYSINALVDSEYLMTISTGNVIEGEVVNYGYPQYLAKDGILYKSIKQNSNPWWGKSFTPSANNEIQSISYSKEGTENIVFCEEAENIDNLTVITGGNTDIRASNRSGAYASADGSIITSLEPGYYILSTALYGNAGTVITFKVGETNVLELSTSGNPVHTNSEIFVVKETSDVIVVGGNGGNSPKIVDYIFIQKVPTELITLTSAEARTYCSENNLDFGKVEGLTAYCLTVSGDQITTTPVNVVDSYSGVYLEGAEGSYEVPFYAGDVTSKPKNDLIGVIEETVVTDLPIYVLMNESNVVGFYKANNGSFTVGAHTAYIPGSAVSADVKALTFGSDDPATGIKGIVSDAVLGKDAVIYNLAGQRVTAPVKGIYIVNGKKVLVK